MSTKLIDRFSDALRQSAPVTMEEDRGTADPLARYRECDEKKNTFDVLFSYVAPNGDLSVKDEEGVTIILKADVLAKDLPFYDTRKRGIFLTRTFTVKITEIDEKNRVVYVRSGRAHRNSLKNQLIGEIMGALKNNEYPKITGRIIRVNDSRALVDIAGKGILGICHVSNWSSAYTRYLKEACKEGEIYDFRITGPLKKQKDKTQGFELSRLDFAEDPWKNIPPEYAVPDAVIAIRCVDKPKGKTFWWGVSKIVPGIEIMGDFTKRFDDVKVYTGITYKCKVTHVDLEKHIFKVVPFEVADSDADTLNAIRFLKSSQRVR